MERRDFFKIAFGVAAGAATFAATAQAAPMLPLNQGARTPVQPQPDAHPAVTTSDEVDHLEPEQVQWRRGWGWRRRGWRRGPWRRRHWRRW